jgi:hypothetical protein
MKLFGSDDEFNPLRAAWIVLRLAFWRFVLWNAGRNHGSRTHAQWMCFILHRTLEKEMVGGWTKTTGSCGPRGACRRRTLRTRLW